MCFRLAVYDRCISTYEQTPQLFTLKKINGVYVTSPSFIIAKTDKVSFGISGSPTGTPDHQTETVFMKLFCTIMKSDCWFSARQYRIR